jgi:hypothetical protein
VFLPQCTQRTGEGCKKIILFGFHFAFLSENLGALCGFIPNGRF